MKILKRIFVFLCCFFIVVTVLVFPSSGSISGVVLDKESMKPIPNITVKLYDPEKICVSDSNGFFTFENLPPGKYKVKFSPMSPYTCHFFKGGCERIVTLTRGGHVFFKQKFDIGGSIKGTIELDKKIHYGDIELNVTSYNGSSKVTYLKRDNSFYIGGLYPAKDYFITIRQNRPGYPYKHITCIEVEAKKCVELPLINFKFDNSTGVEGFIYSSINRNPIPGAKITFDYVDKVKQVGALLDCGSVYTSHDGFFSMKGLEPGKYSVNIAPPVPPQKDPVSGKPLYSMAEYVRLINKIDLIVRKNKRTVIKEKLNIPCFNKPKRSKKKIISDY